MANQSVSVYEKPLPRVGLPDWHSRINQLRTTAEVRRADSYALRHSSRILRNNTTVTTDWDTYHNNARLSDRHAEVGRWRATMEETLARVDREIRLLREEKASTERDLEAIVVPLNVVAECLTKRDSRIETDLTFDDGEVELKKELCIIENNQKMLTDQCHAAWEKLNILAEVKFKLELEIENKKEAQDIDVTQMGLDKFCANITFKPDPTRVPKNATTYDGWLAHTKHIKEMADNELLDTYAMRESLFVCREKARNILHAQQEQTEYTLRRRIFETQKARNELQYQKKNLNDEMDKCLCEIHELEKSYNDKTDALKLAETRLENRAQRSGMELCCDDPYKGLCDEVIQLRKTRRDLVDKIDCAKTTYNALNEHSIRVDIDLGYKQQSMMTDICTLDIRARLKTSENAEPKTQTDRNIVLTRMENEIPAT